MTSIVDRQGIIGMSIDLFGIWDEAFGKKTPEQWLDTYKKEEYFLDGDEMRNIFFHLKEYHRITNAIAPEAETTENLKELVDHIYHLILMERASFYFKRSVIGQKKEEVDSDDEPS